MIMLEALVTCVALITCVIALVRVFWNGLDYVGVKIICGKNDSDTPKQYFKKLLNAAECSMIVYDDGNDMPTSLYADESIVEAVREKLNSTEEFELKCYFNDDANTLFRQELAGLAGVEIRTGNGDAKRDKHFKIIDGGRIGYVSEHDHGAEERDYEVVDCMMVPDKDFNRVAKKALGTYMESFRRKFESAAIAA